VLELNRRSFLQSLGGGLLIFWDASAQESGRRGGGERLPENVGAWLHIARDGSITGFTGKVEVGQNIRTSLTQAVADELRCDPQTVRLVMGDTSLTPWDAGTFGSRTTPTMAPVMRKMAATAREALIEEAAKAWNVDRASLTVANGSVLKAGSKKMGFGCVQNNSAFLKEGPTRIGRPILLRATTRSSFAHGSAPLTAASF